MWACTPAGFHEDAIKLDDRSGWLPSVGGATGSGLFFCLPRLLHWPLLHGMTEILAMREDYRKLMGPWFTFNRSRKLPKIGNMPPALMREALFQSATR